MPGPALLYVLSCREPLPGTHEQYAAAKWRQVVGSTMHCVAGDGIGILAAAVITTGHGLPMWAGIVCEYAFGFLFGWTVFQTLFMKSMFGGYRESLKRTFISELLSMNAVMGGMTAVMVPWMTHDIAAMHPTGARFWFVMSIALCAGFVVALPMNWWLVDHGLKHGMMTVRRDSVPVPQAAVVALAGAALTGVQQAAHGVAWRCRARVRSSPPFDAASGQPGSARGDDRGQFRHLRRWRPRRGPARRSRDEPMKHASTDVVSLADPAATSSSSRLTRAMVTAAPGRRRCAVSKWRESGGGGLGWRPPAPCWFLPVSRLLCGPGNSTGWPAARDRRHPAPTPPAISSQWQ